LYEKTILKRNKNNKVVKGTVYDKNGNVKRYWATSMDEKGNTIEVKTYNSKDSLVKTQSNTYDEYNNRTKIILQSKNTSKYHFKYNPKNQLIEEKDYNGAQNETDIRSYAYDGDG